MLRYWEQEFEQLAPVRRGNRRYYQRGDVLIVRQIRSLLYEHGYTIGGARQCLLDSDNPDATTNKADVEEIIEELERLKQFLTI